SSTTGHYRDQADAAKTGAETAQNYAESYKNAALLAKEAAELAENNSKIAVTDARAFSIQAQGYATVAYDSLTQTISVAEGVATAHEAIIRHMHSMFGGIPQHIKTTGDGAFLNLSGAEKLNLEPGLILKGHITSGAGAVAYMADNTILDLPNVQVFGNEASTLGGAFSVGGSSLLSLRSSVKGGVTIIGNKANGKDNSIHFTGSARVVLGTTNEKATIKIYDPMTDDRSAINARLNITGAGRTKIYATSHLNNTNVDVNGTLELRDGAGLEAKTITVSDGSRFSTVSGIDKRNDVSAQSLIVSGTIAVEVFGDGTNDRISANNVTFEPTSTLEINLDSRRFDELDFKLVDSVLVKGNFGDVNVLGGAKGKLMVLTSNTITAKIYGIGRQTDMASKQGLTKNQKSVAQALDNMSSVSQTGQDIDFVIDRVDHLSAVDVEGMQNALSQASGYFLANVIRDATINNKDVIYSRLNTRVIDNKGDVWGEMKGDFTEYSSDGNSLNDHKDTEIGATVGYDKYLTKGRFANKLLLGAYAKVNKHYVSQSSNNDGEITNAGLGLVGLYNKDTWEARVIIDGSYDLYSTKRQMQFDRIDRTAKANFSGMGLGMDLESALKRDIGNQYTLRPYIGLEARTNSYGSIQEKGADDLGLTVDGDSYNRIVARTGLGVKKTLEKYTWNANIEYKHLLTDTVPTIVTKFGNTNEAFESLGSQEGRSIIGIGAGTNYKVSDGITVFANVNTNIAERLKNVQSNIGASYKFGMPKKEKRKLTKEEKEVVKVKEQVNKLIYKKLTNKLKTYVKN
ncbi:MAG: autotransporter domain-containing protein, partial [Endomicrobium sp.]|nr:autotransporter domain-containing protein [Endomicrobium sp.]